MAFCQGIWLFGFLSIIDILVMLLYFALFAVPVVAYFATVGRGGRSAAFLGMFLGALALILGCADMLGGYDRYIYGAVFDETAEMMYKGYPWYGGSLYALYPKEIGYDMLNVLIGQFTMNRYVFIFTVTLIIYALLFVSLRRYATNYPMALVLFMGLWFFFTFTYLRQVLAASIAWLAVDYAVRRRPWAFFGIVLLAFSFHNSAIVFAPFYFVPQRKMDKNSVIALMVACGVVGLIGTTDALFSQFGSLSGSEARTETYTTEAEGGGFRFDYLLEAVVMLGYILLRYDRIDGKSAKEVTLLNMALVFCAILLVFTKSLNGGRLSWFYMLGLICTLTSLASRERVVTTYSASLVVMMALLFARIVISWGSMLYPYKTFFTDGFRPGDKIHDVYEYDGKYDIDKFYK